MRWNRFIISMTLLFATTATMLASDSINTSDNSTLRSVASKYDRRMQRYRQQWDALIPTQFILQNAGNMGVASAGIGWSYGKRRQWETQLLFGYIPAHQSTRGKLTNTLKENFIPWNIRLSAAQPTDESGSSDRWTDGWSLQPLTASIYLNTVYGHEFWKTQPGRYPNKYYEFMSTKFRLNVALGQRITWQIPHNKRKYAKSISLFYEVSTCDLYLRAKFIDHDVRLKDILGLSVGVKLQTL